MEENKFENVIRVYRKVCVKFEKLPSYDNI